MAFTSRGLRLAKALEKYPKDKPIYFDNINIFNKIKITSVNDECFKATLTVDASMCNGYEILHGGYISSLMDIISLFGIAGKTGGRLSMTNNIHVFFLDQVKIGEKLVAEAKTIKSGRSSVMEALIYKDNGSLVAKAIACFLQGSDEFQKNTSNILNFDVLKND